MRHIEPVDAGTRTQACALLPGGTSSARHGTRAITRSAPGHNDPPRGGGALGPRARPTRPSTLLPRRPTVVTRSTAGSRRLRDELGDLCCRSFPRLARARSEEPSRIAMANASPTAERRIRTCSPTRGCRMPTTSSAWRQIRRRNAPRAPDRRPAESPPLPSRSPIPARSAMSAQRGFDCRREPARPSIPSASSSRRLAASDADAARQSATS